MKAAGDISADSGEAPERQVLVSLHAGEGGAVRIEHLPSGRSPAYSVRAFREGHQHAAVRCEGNGGMFPLRPLSGKGNRSRRCVQPAQQELFARLPGAYDDLAVCSQGSTAHRADLQLPAVEDFESFALCRSEDILVNSAAVLSSFAPFDQIPEVDWDRVMTANLKGMWLCCKAVAPVMRRAG